MSEFATMKKFEERLDEQNIKSMRVAWTVAALSLLVTLGLSGAIYFMLPLKTTDVKVLIVDKNTGYPTEVTSLAEFETGNLRAITGSEALNKFFAQQYIILHDSYQHYSIRDACSKVELFSTDSVFAEYRVKFQPPNNIEQRMGTKRTLEVNVISLSPQSTPTPFKDGDNGVTMTARVEKLVREGSRVLDKTTGTVTMTFGYDTELAMQEAARNINPFGFQVTSYRFDPDQVAQPPVLESTTKEGAQ